MLQIYNKMLQICTKYCTNVVNMLEANNYIVMCNSRILQYPHRMEQIDLKSIFNGLFGACNIKPRPPAVPQKGHCVRHGPIAFHMSSPTIGCLPGTTLD